MTEPASQQPDTADDRMAASIARIERTRGGMLDVLGIVLATGGTCATFAVLFHVLGFGWALTTVAGIVLTAIGLAIMRRSEPVPAWLQVRPPRAVAAAPSEDDERPGVPYAPARTVDEGAPRSPLSGM